MRSCRRQLLRPRKRQKKNSKRTRKGTLIDAVGQSGNAAPHALRLVEAIAGEERARKFERFPPEQRQRALWAYLQDLGKLGR
jgi:hypothetical protein